MPTSARPTAFRVKCLRRRPFFLRRKKGGKERRQNQGFEIFSAAEVLPVPVSFSHANQDKQISCLAFTWPLRLHLRCAPRLCWPGGTGKTSASAVRRREGTPPYKNIACRRVGWTGSSAPAEIWAMPMRAAGIRLRPHINRVISPGCFSGFYTKLKFETP